MSAAEIDRYLADLDEPKRSTLEHLRRTILGLLPSANPATFTATRRPREH